MNDLGKIAVIGAIMGALLLAGLLIRPAGTAVEPTPQPAPVVTTVKDVTIIREKSLEMLGPVYSEKAVFQDDTIRVSFHASFGDEGVESRLPFWLYNLSDEVVSILWDRCSIQLPQGNTIKVLNEESFKYPGGSAISIAPAGDLFDAVIPVSEITWTESDWSVSTSVLDQGTFTFVLAIEKGPTYAAPKSAPVCAQPGQAMGRVAEPMMMRGAMEMANCGECPQSQIVYYAFRFVVR